MSSDPIVERVREAADIVQIVGEHVKLRRSGGDYRGPCPFHGGRNPNFSVSPRRQAYHCFKCGESGDVFSFLQKQLGMSFPDALQTVAQTVGIEVPRQRPERQGPDPREPFWEMNAAAAEWFTRMLWDDERGRAARDYLGKRGLTQDDASRFSLGYAPDDLGAFRDAMASLGFEAERLVDGGLLAVREERPEPRLRFRNRVMFPIMDAQGRHVAFGGRALGDVEPKYLNSPETPVFQKSRTLYALNWCRNGIRRADRAFVVEGYMDAIRLLVAGVDAVVAPLGTALTEQQAESLARYSKNVFLLYDSDQAGLKATFRAGDELLRHGCTVRVVTLPEGEDPDTFVRGHGAAGLEQYVAEAVDVFERKIQILERGGWFDELHRKRRALDRLLPTIRAVTDPLLRDLYVSRAAEKSGVARDVLLREVAEAPPPARPESVPEASPTATNSTSAAARRRDRRRDYGTAGHSAERELVRVMLHDPNRAETIAAKVGPEEFRDPRYRAAFVAILALGDEYTVERLAAELDEDAVEEVNALLSEGDGAWDFDALVDGSLARLAARRLSDELARIDDSISLASEEEKGALTMRKVRLQQELRELGQTGRQSTAKLLGSPARRRPA